MFTIEYATEIEECVRCERLYFPGDEVVLTSDGYVHANEVMISKYDVSDLVAL